VRFIEQGRRIRGGFLRLEPAHHPNTAEKFCHASLCSTAMPLCHWPAHVIQTIHGQVHDWMNEIYPRWVAAHGIMMSRPCTGTKRPVFSIDDGSVGLRDGGVLTQPRHTVKPGRSQDFGIEGMELPETSSRAEYFPSLSTAMPQVQEIWRAPDELVVRHGISSAGIPALLIATSGIYEPYSTESPCSARRSVISRTAPLKSRAGYAHTPAIETSVTRRIRLVIPDVAIGSAGIPAELFMSHNQFVRALSNLLYLRHRVDNDGKYFCPRDGFGLIHPFIPKSWLFRVFTVCRGWGQDSSMRTNRSIINLKHWALRPVHGVTIMIPCAATQRG